MYALLGSENYENQLKYGAEIFQELKHLEENGYHFEGIHHDIQIVCCCDWKAGACIEGEKLTQNSFAKITLR